MFQTFFSALLRRTIPTGESWFSFRIIKKRKIEFSCKCKFISIRKSIKSAIGQSEMNILFELSLRIGRAVLRFGCKQNISPDNGFEHNARIGQRQNVRYMDWRRHGGYLVAYYDIYDGTRWTPKKVNNGPNFMALFRFFLHASHTEMNRSLKRLYEMVHEILCTFN